MSGTMKLTEMIRNLERERDEARAECERLRVALQQRTRAVDCTIWREKLEDARAENERLREHIGFIQSEDFMPHYELLKKDAERYRWLREKCKAYPAYPELRLTIARDDGWRLLPWSGDDPDRKIDAALRGEEE